MESYQPNFPERLSEDIRKHAREMRSTMLTAEALFWALLRNRRFLGLKFRRQHPIGRYILDFYCDEKKLAIELDGSQHAENVAYDATRDECLASQGIRVLRFWNNQALNETEAVLEAIYSALNAEVGANSLTPTPLPPAGEGLQGALT